MSLAIIIKATGWEKVRGGLGRLRGAIRDRIPQTLDLIGEEIVGISRQDYLSGPRPKKLGRVSGDLARSVLHRKRGSNSVEVGSNLVYAPVHEFGATIRAKRAPYLVFKTLDGQWHSRKSVRIPPRPFLVPALKDAQDSILFIIDKMVQAAKAEALGNA